jgi:hypothetical protein
VAGVCAVDGGIVGSLRGIPAHRPGGDGRSHQRPLQGIPVCWHRLFPDGGAGASRVAPGEGCRVYWLHAEGHDLVPDRGNRGGHRCVRGVAGIRRERHPGGGDVHRFCGRPSGERGLFALAASPGGRLGNDSLAFFSGDTAGGSGRMPGDLLQAGAVGCEASTRESAIVEAGGAGTIQR